MNGFARFAVNITQSVAGKIDEQFFACCMCKDYRRFAGNALLQKMIAKLRVER
jgi:hypothetical protein